MSNHEIEELTNKLQNISQQRTQLNVDGQFFDMLPYQFFQGFHVEGKE